MSVNEFDEVDIGVDDVEEVNLDGVEEVDAAVEVGKWLLVFLEL